MLKMNGVYTSGTWLFHSIEAKRFCFFPKNFNHVYAFIQCYVFILKLLFCHNLLTTYYFFCETQNEMHNFHAAIFFLIKESDFFLLQSSKNYTHTLKKKNIKKVW